MTDWKIKPFSRPKMIMVDQVLKNTTKEKVLLNPRTEIANKVEKPPWKIPDPITLIAFETL